MKTNKTTKTKPNKTKQKEFKSDLHSITREKHNSQEQEGALRNIKMLYKTRDKVINILMIILQLYVRLNMHHFKEEDSKY